MKIALDAMGGDHAPAHPVAAARPALAPVPRLGLDADLINKFHTTVMGDEWPIAND
jgi:fatty acid/phospholipid biosynthesis enzyme